MASSASSEQHGHTVLVVDDDAANRAVLADVLRDAGYAVETAAAGDEAIQRLDAAAARWCAVVLDLALPAVSGVDVLRHLHPRSATLPVLVVSADAEQCVAAVEAGAAVVITKPFDIDALAGAVRDLVRVHCRQTHA
jgi:DNA-binding response OmpR family regulator